jgi:HK97 gp10 family phage protein
VIDITAKVRGLEELQETLDKKAKQMVKNYIRRAAKSAADIWVKALEERLPVGETGYLHEHVEVMTRFLEASTKLELKVGPDKKAYYDIFVEFGTRFRAANPVMREVFEEFKDQVMEAFAEALRVELRAMAA